MRWLCGVGLARLAATVLRAYPPDGLVRIDGIAIDVPVLVAAATLTTGIVLALGMLLGVRAARTPATSVLRSGRGRASRHRFHRTLAVGQVSMSYMLLVVSLSLTSQLRQLTSADVGLAGPPPVTMTIAGAERAFFDDLLPELATLPGVEAVGVASSLPPHLPQMQTTINPPEGTLASALVPVDIVAVSLGTAEALGLRLLEGTFFSAADFAPGRASLVISARAAATLFPARSAVGRTLPFGPAREGAPAPTVVGVVDDVRYRGLDAAPEGSIYLPYTQRLFDVMHLVVRTRLDPAQVLPAIRDRIAAVDPFQAIGDARGIDQLVVDATSATRLRARIIAMLAAAAVLLAALGVYGVLGQMTHSRRHEYAVRSALGAGPGLLQWQVMASGVSVVGAGLMTGAILWQPASTALAALTGNAAPTGLAAYLTAMTVVMVAGLFASWRPAVRASRSPTRSLLAG